MIVLGIDPGFADLGWALVEIHKDTQELVYLDAIKTRKSTKKQNVYATEDNVRRMLEIGDALDEVLGLVSRAYNEEVVAICTEAMSWPRNASASIKVALGWGVVVELSRTNRIPIVQVSPKQLKNALTGSESASKDDIHAAVKAHPGFTEIDRHLEKIGAKARRAHPVDACAAVIACLDSQLIQLARKM